MISASGSNLVPLRGKGAEKHCKTKFLLKFPEQSGYAFPGSNNYTSDTGSFRKYMWDRL